MSYFTRVNVTIFRADGTRVEVDTSKIVGNCTFVRAVMYSAMRAAQVMRRGPPEVARVTCEGRVLQEHWTMQQCGVSGSHPVTIEIHLA